ncbi:GNAT family N-acetyltransferase [Niallia sp. MER TA 168]|uniref:GNAT family N-acetyltransferase n=1 Tax=Niallia sp. MER TA 168 TaxID=2939568 RepID=UPI00203B933E|nr:GNAT family N-acetyltransferase [Niallia sp. MER TA 168]MCM3364097.1 GNAT family N-acetyltransferase [Niallia sp. MER TA 168]
MMFHFQLITQEQAEEIAYQWHYDGIYGFYDMDADEEDLAAFLDRDQRNESIYAVTEENQLIGFFSINKADNDTIDIGLGLRPDLTGQKKGSTFLTTGMNYIKEHFSPSFISLAVATFNKRAIKVYRKVGFKETTTFIQSTNGGEFEFVQMIYTCSPTTKKSVDSV